ncbi:hypothetical protein HDV06_005658 [Boothiomyces sp. JEL0866]|nr:hypothetical protein HDV06_005658 [Boothiomyces sp. JEL0866]
MQTHQFFPPNNKEMQKLELQIEALNKILNEYSKQEPPLLQRWRSKVYQQMVTHKFEVLGKDADINRLQELLMKYESDNLEKDFEISKLKDLLLEKENRVNILEDEIVELKQENEQLQNKSADAKRITEKMNEFNVNKIKQIQNLVNINLGNLSSNIEQQLSILDKRILFANDRLLMLKSMNDQESKNFEYVKQEKNLLQLEVVQLQKDRKALLHQLLNKPEIEAAQHHSQTESEDKSNLEISHKVLQKSESLSGSNNQTVQSEGNKKIQPMDKLEALDQLSELLLKIV